MCKYLYTIYIYKYTHTENGNISIVHDWKNYRFQKKPILSNGMRRGHLTTLYGLFGVWGFFFISLNPFGKTAMEHSWVSNNNQPLS